MQEKHMNKSSIRAEKVSIEFPGVKALTDVDFKLETGEIRAVVGANGAGKSTLMKVFAGVNANYTGQLYVDEKPVEIRNPLVAKKHGIEIVYQEVDTALFPDATVAENIMMNKMIGDMKGSMFVDWKSFNKEAQELLDRLNIPVSATRKAGSLSLAQKQMVLIAKSVRTGCKFLVLDEPTAPLSISETEDLFKIVRNMMKMYDMSIVFITHRLQEVLQICDNITVMRNGKVITNIPVTPELTQRNIVDLMLGRSFEENFPKIHLDPGEVHFEVIDVADHEGKVNGVTMNVRRGEIVGIAGLVGAGKTELCKLLFGAKKRSRGVIKLNGKELNIRIPQDAVANGIGMVPEERRKEGVMVDEPVYFNLSAANLKAFCNKLSFVNRKDELENAHEKIEMLKIKTPTERQLVRYLSGGNQQKVVVGKWLSADSDVYIFDEPTKGIDVGAKREIFTLIQEIAKSGKSVIYATCETSEILSITDRIYVMYDGKVTKELVTRETTENEIMFYSTGTGGK